jgi:hypothetical protein
MQNGQMHEQEIRHAMRQIRHVLRGKPAAADTVQGIHAWWIEWSEPGPHWSTTEQALERLQAEGVVECVTLEDGRKVWRAAGKSRES